MENTEKNTENKRQDLSDEDFKIVFYCKDCEKIVDTEKVGGRYVYKCKKCGTKNVAFGTKRSIYNFFRLEEMEKKAKMREKIEEKRSEERGKR